MNKESIMRKFLLLSLTICLFILSGCATAGVSTPELNNTNLDKDITGLYTHSEYPDLYSVVIYNQDGDNVSIAVKATRTNNVGMLMQTATTRKDLLMLSSNETTFDYTDSCGNTGICHFIVNENDIFLGFTAKEPYQGGFCVDAANGTFVKVQELSEIVDFNIDDYGPEDVADTPLNRDSQKNIKNSNHGKELDAFDFIDYTEYYATIGENYDEEMSIEFWSGNAFDRNHYDNPVKSGEYHFYKSDNSDYEFKLVLSYDDGNETILYGNSIKYKDVLDLYEYIPDEDGYMFFGKYISQVYAHNPNMVR